MVASAQGLLVAQRYPGHSYQPSRGLRSVRRLRPQQLRRLEVLAVEVLRLLRQRKAVAAETHGIPSLLAPRSRRRRPSMLQAANLTQVSLC